MNREEYHQRMYPAHIVRGDPQFFLLGRGGYAIFHRGNQKVRALIAAEGAIYATAPINIRGSFAKDLYQDRLQLEMTFVMEKAYFLRQYRADRISKEKIASLVPLYGEEWYKLFQEAPEDAYFEVSPSWVLDVLGHLYREASTKLRREQPQLLQQPHCLQEPQAWMDTGDDNALPSLVPAAASVDLVEYPTSSHPSEDEESAKLHEAPAVDTNMTCPSPTGVAEETGMQGCDLLGNMDADKNVLEAECVDNKDMTKQEMMCFNKCPADEEDTVLEAWEFNLTELQVQGESSSFSVSMMSLESKEVPSQKLYDQKEEEDSSIGTQLSLK